jgi:hypothetical protein
MDRLEPRPRLRVLQTAVQRRGLRLDHDHPAGLHGGRAAVGVQQGHRGLPDVRHRFRRLASGRRREVGPRAQAVLLRLRRQRLQGGHPARAVGRRRDRPARPRDEGAHRLGSAASGQRTRERGHARPLHREQRGARPCRAGRARRHRHPRRAARHRDGVQGRRRAAAHHPPRSRRQHDQHGGRQRAGAYARRRGR